MAGASEAVNPPPYVEKILAEARSLKPEPVAGTLSGQRNNGSAPALVSVIRNESGRLDAFLAHYRALGVARFLLIDNDSDDGTRELLAGQPDVTLFAMPGPFSWERKQAWMHAVITQHDPSGWYLAVDADERVVYDRCGQHALPALVRLLEQQSLVRARGMLVDLYPDGPLLTPEDDHEPSTHRWFDAGGYRERSVRRMISRTGGPRHRRFSLDGEALTPELTKYPLFRAGPGTLMANPHHHFPYPENFHSPCILGVLHEKFRFDFPRRIREAVRAKQYWNESHEYRAYAQVLDASPALSLHGPDSREYQSPDDLIRCGLVDPIPWPGSKSGSRPAR